MEGENLPDQTTALASEILQDMGANATKIRMQPLCSIGQVAR